MVIFYALAAFLYVFDNAVARLVYPGKCPYVEAQPNVDVNKFSGIWYQVGRYVMESEPASVCSLTNFVPSENGNINVTDFYVTDTLNVVSHLIMTPHRDDSSLYHFQFPFTGESTDCKFLGSDYDYYTDVACCANNGTNNVRYVYLMTRNPLPQKSTMKKAYEVLDRNNVDTKPLQEINMKNCLSMNAFV